MLLKFSKEAEKSASVMIQEAMKHLCLCVTKTGKTIIGISSAEYGWDVQNPLLVTDVFYWNTSTNAIDTQVALSSIMSGGSLILKDGTPVVGVVKYECIDVFKSVLLLDDKTAQELTIGYLKTWGYLK